MMDNIDMNLDQRRCEECGGKILIERMDMNHIYFVCEHCSNETTYVFQSEEEAQYYKDEPLQNLMAELRKGIVDEQTANWKQLHKAFIELINQQPRLETDLQVQMALVACLTRGFHAIDSEAYQQCKIIFKVVDKMYKQRIKLLKAQMRNPAFSDSIRGYQVSRNKYVQLRNEYLQTKMMYKMFWSILKLFLK